MQTAKEFMEHEPHLCRASQMANIIDAQHYHQGVQELSITRALTDSRSLTVAEGTLFFALRTKSGDGHLYIDELYRKGIRAFVVADSVAALSRKCPEAWFWQSDDVYRALRRLAIHHRERMTCGRKVPFIGITGSNGKTTVKEILSSLLEPYYHRITRSPGSYNSQIGVPLSVLLMRPDTDLAIIEAGISQPGEMAHLAEVIRPDTVVVTNVGSAHGENFVSSRALMEEKLELVRSGGVRHVVCSADQEELLSRLKSIPGITLTTYSLDEKQSGATLRARYEYNSHGTMLHITRGEERYSVQSPLEDFAGVQNVLVCLCAALVVCPDRWPQVLQQISSIEPLAMRLEIKESRTGTTIINDSYSCDLESLGIALDFMHRRSALVRGGNNSLAAILSDIDGSALSDGELYRALGNLLVQYGVKRVYGIGKDIRLLSSVAEIELKHYPDVSAFLDSDAVSDALKQGFVLVRGARRFGFERIVQSLALREHQTRLEINLASLRNNLAYYRQCLPQGHSIICMIKADAYGLGAYEVARTLEESHVQCLAVAVADEAKALRKRGIHTPIMVMNPEESNLHTLSRHNLALEVYSLELFRAAVHHCLDYSQELVVHLKVDTGMHRLGVSKADIPELADLYCKAAGRIKLSVFSHLAAADEPEKDAFTHEQAERLRLFTEELRRCINELDSKSRINHLPIHLLNTAGIERFGKLYAFDAVRLGIGLYGASPTLAPEIQPVAKLLTTILQIKWLDAGDCVGYGLTGVVTKPTQIAIIPIGYADGLRRSLGNGAWAMLVRGQSCPTFGRICMDTCMIDVTEVEGVQVGDKVVVFGEEPATLEKLAETADTITYEILTSISPRVERVYLQS